MAVTQAYYKDENRDVGNEAVVAGVNASAGNEAEVTIDRTQLDVNKRETNILGQAVESNEEPAHVKAARLAQEAKRRAERNVFNKTEERHQQHKCMRRCASCCPCLKNWLLGKELVEGKTPLMRTMQAFEMTKRDSAISASRRVEAPSRHRGDSCPSQDAGGRLFVEFEAVRTEPRCSAQAARSCRTAAPSTRSLGTTSLPRS